MGIDALSDQAVRRYKLDDVRKRNSTLPEAEHQQVALKALGDWFAAKGEKGATRGAVLSLPTGAGKTFTAVRFLCGGPLANGCKVIWLAHTHHLLEQAFNTFGPDPAKKGARFEVGKIGGSRSTLTTRVVSGAPGHHRPRHIRADDDVLIATLQTLSNAEKRGQPNWRAFVDSAREKGLVVVFDEAHHAPANTYRALIQAITAAVPRSHVLGLTATPDYGDPRRAGWLRELFPQAVIHRTAVQPLIAAGVLSRPVFTTCQTHVKATISTESLREIRTRFGDLPDDVIDRIASNADRNRLIAKTWLEKREVYGKTIVFTDRWPQCEAIREELERGGARVGVVYHHTAAQTDGGHALAAQRNAKTLDAFRNGKLDVVVNIRMLTEGTDVPSAQTAFLTRQTTSRILLTQMIGRVLRGPKFGGTAEAHVVSFIDDWAEGLPWAEWDMSDGGLETGVDAAKNKRMLKLVSIDLVREFLRALEVGDDAKATFLSWLPVGWYEVTYTASTGVTNDDYAGDDETVEVWRLVMVFDAERALFEHLLREIDAETLARFRAPDLDPAEAAALAEPVIARFFPAGARPGKTPSSDLAQLLRHLAQGNPQPVFYPFERRDDHDLDALAMRLFRDEIEGPRLDAEARLEFTRADRYWRALFADGDAFEKALKAAMDRVINGRGVGEAAPGSTSSTPASSLIAGADLRQREVSAEVARAVFRKYPCCLACGDDRFLQVDHVRASYYGGSSDLENLQTLCRRCNIRKGVNEIDFRGSDWALEPELRWSAVAPSTLLDDTTRVGLERFVRRELNFYFQCAAVKRFSLVGQGERSLGWEVEVEASVPSKHADVPVKAVLSALAGDVAGMLSPSAVTITGGQQTVVVQAPRRKR